MAKKLLSNGAVVYDTWQIIDDTVSIEKTSELPVGKVIVSIAHWNRFKETLLKRGPEKLGLILQPNESPAMIANELEFISVMALNFPVFTDGRGYSHARELREHFNFSGEIRAVGDVLIDQLYAMRRCGFDAFIMRKSDDVDLAHSYLSTFSFPYQGAVDDPRPVWHR